VRHLGSSSAVPTGASTDMKLIPLNPGYFAKVDDEDFEAASQFEWRVRTSKRSDTLYAYRAVRNSNGTRTQELQRFILGITDLKVEVHHAPDHDGLNNQRSNLQVVAHVQNTRHRKLNKNTMSGFKGVSRFGKKWRAYIRVHGTQLHLGYFDGPVDAALAYDVAALEYFGEFALTNASLGLLKKPPQSVKTVTEAVA
jgi:hypothetical protein